jgi:acetate---CoA ligase (ADP-forming)
VPTWRALWLDGYMGAPVAFGRDEVALSDGSTVRLRPVTHEDEAAIEAFLGHLSLRSFAQRFFTGGGRPHQMAHSAADVDDHDRFGLLAEIDGTVVGHAMYVRSGPHAAEAAFVVADNLQCHGLGRVLVTKLAAVAADRGFYVLEAYVLRENHRMLDVFAQSGLPLRMRPEPGVVHVTATLPRLEEEEEEP